MSTFKTLGGKSLEQLPQIPTDLDASAIVGGIDLEWVNNNTNVTGTTNSVEIFEDPSWVEDSEVAASATTASITGLSFVQDYNVRVAVKDGSRIYPSRVSTSTILEPSERPQFAQQFVPTSYGRGTNNSINPSTEGEITICWWGKVEAGGSGDANKIVIAQATENGSDYAFQPDSNRLFARWDFNEGNVITNITHTFTNGVWLFAAISVKEGDASGMISRLYSESALIDTNTNSTVGHTMFDTTYDRICVNTERTGLNSGRQNVTGDIGVWTRALTTSEMDEIWNDGDGVKYSNLSTAQKVGLVNWYDFDDSSDPYADQHGSNPISSVSGTINRVAI